MSLACFSSPYTPTEVYETGIPSMLVSCLLTPALLYGCCEHVPELIRVDPFCIAADVIYRIFLPQTGA